MITYLIKFFLNCILNICVMYTHLIISPYLKTAYQKRKDKINRKVKRDKKIICTKFEKKKVIINFD